MRLSTCVVAPLALAVASCSGGRAVDDQPTCFPQPYIPIDATSGSLVFHATREDLACPNVACLEACPVEEGVDGVEVAVCRPEFREEGTPASGCSFVIGSGQLFEETGTARRVVRIASTNPRLTFSFELPDVRSLDGDHAWSSPVHDPEFTSRPCSANMPPEELTVAGRLRVLSRTGGPDDDALVTDDYHAVVEVSGRLEAVGGSNGNGPCLFLPATEFSFTYEEGEVAEGGYCLLAL